MKKRIVFYFTLITSIFSLQSCVTNYVVSEPTVYNKEYKPSANLAKIDAARLELNKKTLINSFASEKSAKIQKSNNSIKKSEIASAIKHATLIDELLKEAETYLGVPYRYGGTTRKGIDCSAFVLSVFGAAANVTLPRVSRAQALEGKEVSKSEIQKGDLVFFSHGRGIAHVGIVEDVTAEGEIKFIHAATSRGVMISSLNDNYWGPRYRFAKRIINENDGQPDLAKIN